MNLILNKREIEIQEVMIEAISKLKEINNQYKVAGEDWEHLRKTYETRKVKVLNYDQNDFQKVQELRKKFVKTFASILNKKKKLEDDENNLIHLKLQKEAINSFSIKDHLRQLINIEDLGQEIRDLCVS